MDSLCKVCLRKAKMLSDLLYPILHFTPSLPRNSILIPALLISHLALYKNLIVPELNVVFFIVRKNGTGTYNALHLNGNFNCTSIFHIVNCSFDIFQSVVSFSNKHFWMNFSLCTQVHQVLYSFSSTFCKREF